MQWVWRVSATAMLWLVGSGFALAQGQAMKNPLEGNQDAVKRGSLFFRARCAGCHGLDAKGISGPDLTAVLGGGMSDQRFYQTIRRGVPGTEMPAFSSEQNTDTQVWEILSHLRTLTAGGAAEKVTGNAENGAKVFQANCAACHSVNGKGGHLGPNLSTIGSARSPSALSAKVRNPSQSIVSGFQPITLVMVDGKRIRGVKKNEDAFSIQVMDTTERIQGFQKTDVKDVIRETRSIMPAFGPERLSDQNLNDLVTYLNTLRRADAKAATAGH